jgi:hypothetical protein
LNGFCYVDPAAAEEVSAEDGITPEEQSWIDGQAALVADCSSTERRMLRFVGDDLPAEGAHAFIACLGATAP